MPNWTAANPLKTHVTRNELQIGFVPLGNMRANGVRTFAVWCPGAGCRRERLKVPIKRQAMVI